MTISASRAVADARVANAARAAYSRLLASLARRTGDLAVAEDALGEAFKLALERWPRDGIPASAEGWLMTVARNRWLDVLRRLSRAPTINLPDDLSVTEPEADRCLPDRRLELLFVCAHPAIDERVRAPLMLQTVLGLDAADVGRLFLVPAAAMAQRLVRAKRKIKDAHIPFRTPEQSELQGRVEAVLEAVYGACSASWDTAAGEELGGEALFLSELLAELLPEEPEVQGLAALVAYIEARRPARSGVCYLPLDQQPTDKWDRSLIDRAELRLLRSAKLARPGRFQYEAAIQSAHVAGRLTGSTDWRSVLLLYEALWRVQPTVGAAVGRAAAIGRVLGPEVALPILFSVPEALRLAYQPALAVEASLRAELGQNAEAIAVYSQAERMTADPLVRAWLEEKRREIQYRVYQ